MILALFYYLMESVPLIQWAQVHPSSYKLRSSLKHNTGCTWPGARQKQPPLRPGSLQHSKWYFIRMSQVHTLCPFQYERKRERSWKVENPQRNILCSSCVEPGYLVTLRAANGAGRVTSTEVWWGGLEPLPPFLRWSHSRNWGPQVLLCGPH